MGEFISDVASSLHFDKSTEIGAVLDRDNVQDAIEQAYTLAKGIRTFPFPLHYVSKNSLNTSMSNGTIFRVGDSLYNSMSYSGYPSGSPMQTPFRCRLFSMILTFRRAYFDYNAVAGPILWELETRGHLFNGSYIQNRILVRFGNWSGNSTNETTHRYELFYNDSGGEGFEYLEEETYDREIDYAEQIGCRFVKAPSGDRRINSWTDLILKLNFEEAPNA